MKAQEILGLVALESCHPPVVESVDPGPHSFQVLSLFAGVCQSAMSFAQVDKILTEQSLSKLHIFLKKQSNDSLAAVSTHDPLDQLNPAVHSLGYLFVLYVINRVLEWC